jgi:hypothetical protein
MKRILSTLVFVLAVVAMQAQSIDEIVKKHVEAIGGEANWRKVKNFVMKGNIKANGADVSLTTTLVDAKGMRVDMDIFSMKNWVIMTTTEGWTYMPIQGQTKPEAMTAEDIKSTKDELHILDPFITYKEMGKKIEFVGKDDMEGVECLKLKLTNKDGVETSYWIDPTNYYTLKSVMKATINGKEEEQESTFSNYKKHAESGIVFPMTTNSMMGDMEITSLEVNAKLDDNIFKPVVETK